MLTQSIFIAGMFSLKTVPACPTALWEVGGGSAEKIKLTFLQVQGERVYF